MFGTDSYTILMQTKTDTDSEEKCNILICFLLSRLCLSLYFLYILLLFFFSVILMLKKIFDYILAILCL